MKWKKVTPFQRFTHQNIGFNKFYKFVICCDLRTVNSQLSDYLTLVLQLFYKKRIRIDFIRDKEKMSAKDRINTIGRHLSAVNSDSNGSIPKKRFAFN